MEHIENAVQSQEQYVVRRDILHVLQFVDHEQLGKDREGLQPHAEAPHEIDGVEGLMDEDCHDQGSQIHILMLEGVGVPVVTEVKWLAEAHEVDGVGGEADEQDFHDEEVHGLPAEEQVEVAGDKNGQIDLLGLEGQT